MKTIFINCSNSPYVDMIAKGQKVIETRSRNTLKSLIGERVYIAETGKGKPLVKCSAFIESVFTISTVYEWESFRPLHMVPRNGRYDWAPDTKVKYLYVLKDARPCKPFHPPVGVRHGRVWME